MDMPGPENTLNTNFYRYAFQGQEKDSETNKEAFELRLWDSRIGRWLTTDPAGQFNSPYLGMGNDPTNSIDPDGAFKWKWWAKTVNALIYGDGVKYDENRGEWYVQKFDVSLENKSVLYEGNRYDYQEPGVVIRHIYSSPEFYLDGGAGLSLGPQLGVNLRLLGAKGALSGHKNRVKTNLIGGGISNKQGLYNTSNPVGDYDHMSSGYSVGLVVGADTEFYPSGTLIPSQYHGQLKSESLSLPVFGTFTKEYDLSGLPNENTVRNKSWGVGADVKIALIGFHFNFDGGYKH